MKYPIKLLPSRQRPREPDRETNQAHLSVLLGKLDELAGVLTLLLGLVLVLLVLGNVLLGEYDDVAVSQHAILLQLVELHYDLGVLEEVWHFLNVLPVHAALLLGLATPRRVAVQQTGIHVRRAVFLPPCLYFFSQNLEERGYFGVSFLQLLFQLYNHMRLSDLVHTVFESPEAVAGTLLNNNAELEDERLEAFQNLRQPLPQLIVFLMKFVDS